GLTSWTHCMAIDAIAYCRHEVKEDSGLSYRPWVCTRTIFKDGPPGFRAHGAGCMSRFLDWLTTRLILIWCPSLHISRKRRATDKTDLGPTHSFINIHLYEAITHESASRLRL